jgi:hypothetical protein
VSRIPEIAMYYPYIHIRDDNWLKAAALYWPRLARLTPARFPRYDSKVAKALTDDLGFLLNIKPPANQVNQVAKEFLDFILVNRDELKRRYNPDTESDHAPIWGDAVREMARFDAYPLHGSIDVGKMTSALRHHLVDLGLGKTVDDDRQVVVHPAVSAAYTLTLVDRIAKANQLAVVTDQPRLHELRGGRVGEELANTLLGTPFNAEGGRVHAAGDVAALYAVLAVKTVVPQNIETVPVKKIVKVRTKLAVEFDVFREHLNTLTDEFSELGQVENLTILQERLQMLVDRDLRRPTAALERSLRQLGLEPASAVLGAKTLELPALAAAAASVAGVPVIASQAGLVTARLIGAGAQAHSKRRDARQNSPVGYLLGLKRQIRPRRGFIERIRHPFG